MILSIRSPEITREQHEEMMVPVRARRKAKELEALNEIWGVDPELEEVWGVDLELEEIWGQEL